MTRANTAFIRLRFGWGKRLPVFQQTEATECGLACLAMLASYHGHETDLVTLRRRFPISLKGASLARLIEIANELGLQSRPLRADLSELSKLHAPCILHWDLNHFVVLKKVTKKYVYLHDPAVGERRLSLTEVSRFFTGIVLELTPGVLFKPVREVSALPLRSLIGKILGLKRALIQIFSLALVLELLALISPLFVQILMDQVLADGDYDLLTMLGIGFILLTLVQAGITALRSWSVTCLGMNLNLAWTGNVFNHLLKLPEDYFGKRHLGDIVSRFGSINAIQQTLTTRFVEVILDGLMAILTFGMMLLYSPWLALITLTAFALYAILRIVSYHSVREANLSQIIASSKQQTQFLESVRGAQTIRLFNQGSSQSARYMNKTADTLNAGIVVQRLTLIFSSLNSVLFGIQRIAMIWLGARMALDSVISAGMLMAFSSYSDQFTARGAALVDYLIDLRMLRLQGERLADIVLSEPEKDVLTSYHNDDPDASIELCNVSFRYAEGEPWVLRNCDLKIASGETIALVGLSGCGKTTLAKILLGLLDPQEGKILIGGIELQRLGKARYRDMLGTVMQDDQLFSGSLADNISFFDQEAHMLKVEAAARLAALHEDIATMPMNYHSLIGDMGSSLSGGQKQRLLLARALYRKPKILVLDEATSHLDTVRERLVNDAVRHLNVTRIIVAHRLETISIADRVIEISQGQAFDRGQAVRAINAKPDRR
jgi:ATP-binding cassette subfamily B protein RaxB